MGSTLRFFNFILFLMCYCAEGSSNRAGELLPHGTRAKRVVAGDPILTRHSAYKATRYIVWMGNGHSCRHVDRSKYSIDCSPVYNDQRCDASLLTTTILQTACHCLSQFKGPTANNWTKATVVSSWEDKLDIFFGYSTVPQFSLGIVSRKFYIHQKCALLSVEPAWMVTHDFGLVTLSSPADQGDLKTYEQDYAPIYPVGDLAKMYAYNMNTRAVCLTLGFGYFMWERGRVKPAKSDLLRHGWVVNQEYWKCYYWTMIEWPVPEGTFKYEDYATWMCGLWLYNHKDYISMGDVGGPLSCNNQYMGIISLAGNITKPGPDSGKVLQMFTAIAFNPFDNAFEYRQDLESKIQEPNEPTFKPNILSFKPHSSSISTAPSLIVLLTMSLAWIAGPASSV